MPRSSPTAGSRAAPTGSVSPTCAPTRSPTPERHRELMVGVIEGFARHVAPETDAPLVVAGPESSAVADAPERRGAYARPPNPRDGGPRMVTLTEKQEELCAQTRWDFS